MTSPEFRKALEKKFAEDALKKLPIEFLNAYGRFKENFEIGGFRDVMFKGFRQNEEKTFFHFSGTDEKGERCYLVGELPRKEKVK